MKNKERRSSAKCGTYNKGDLVKIVQTSLQYFANRLGIIIKCVHTIPGIRKEDQIGFERPGDYYLVKLSDSDDTHVFHQEDLQLLSKVPKRKGS